MYSKYQLTKLLANYFQNINRISWIKLIPVAIHLKHWYHDSPYLESLSFPHHLCKLLPWSTEIPPQRNPNHVLHQLPYVVLTHWTTHHYKYCIYQTIWQAKPIKFITMGQTHYPSKSWVFKSRFSFKVRERDLNFLILIIRNIVSVNKIKGINLSFIRPKENSVFTIHDTKGLKLLKHLRLNFSHLNEHKFRHCFKDTVDPMCKWSLETEITLHFLLYCKMHSTIRTELLDNIYTVASSLTNYPDEKLLNILLYGSKYFTVKTKQSILKSTIKFLKRFERYDDPLFL